MNWAKVSRYLQCHVVKKTKCTQKNEYQKFIIFFISERKNCKNQRRHRKREKKTRRREEKIGGGQEGKIERTT